MESRWINSILPLLTKRNSRFITLAFREGTDLVDMQRLVQAFRGRLIELSGIHTSRLFTASIYLTQPVKHVHMIALGDKDLQTGRSITTMPKEKVESLFSWWREEAGNTGKWQAIWDPKTLISYLTGLRNTSRAHQVWAEDLHNEAFLDRLHKRLERRRKIESAGVHGLTDHSHPSPV